MSGLLLSIDFEDFAHDLKRELGLWDSGPLRTEALWASFDRIERVLTGHGGARATFFCTGIVARHAPDLIRHIADAGHEIACHSYFHDTMDRQTAAQVAEDAARAKDVLETASGQEVLGFRAPKFRIEKTDPAQYRAIALIFAYDSSWFGRSPGEARGFRERMGIESLRLFPLFAGRPVAAGPEMRLGGSFLKLLPAALARRLIAGSEAAGLTPHLYLHPYEFASGGAFRLDRRDLAPLGSAKSAYWRLRQVQWLDLGNAGLERKLNRLIAGRGLLGRLRDNMDHAI